jgi:hypothetical protein
MNPTASRRIEPRVLLIFGGFCERAQCEPSLLSPMLFLEVEVKGNGGD